MVGQVVGPVIGKVAQKAAKKGIEKLFQQLLENKIQKEGISALKLAPEIAKNIKNKMNNFVNKKKITQPEKIKTCGSTFKNPKDVKAWKLIKDSGCAGMKIGDAQISQKHCNFFVNNGNAKSNDLEELILQVKKKVLDKTGINLELELQIIGEKL